MRRFSFAAVVLSAGLAFAPAAHAAPLTPAFTYQGEIFKAGSPVTGTADLRFTLWDSAAGGLQIGPQVNRNNVGVSGGVFTTSLDFGVLAFADGEERYLQIELRSPAGAGAFTTLTTRQPITATPYAVSAMRGAAPFRVQRSSSDSAVLVDADAFYQVQMFNASGGSAGGIASNGGGVVFYPQNQAGSATAALGTSGDQAGFLEMYTSTGGQVVLLEASSTEFGEAGYLRLAGSGAGTEGGAFQMTNNIGQTTLEATGGGAAESSTVSLFDGGVETLRMFGQTAVPGGSIYTYDENGSTEWVLEPDFSGDGAFMAFSSPNGGLYMESSSSGSPAMSLFGAGSAFFLSGASSGDAAVQLATDAVNSTEMLNEPGIANVQGGFIAIPTATTSMLSRSITVPTSGFVVVLFDGDVGATHTSGSGASSVEWFLDDVAGGAGSGDDDMLWTIPSNSVSGLYDFSASSHAVFEVPSAGTYTYHVNMRRSANLTSPFLFDGQLTLMYFPTAYGTTDPSFMGPSMRGTPTGNSGVAAKGPQTPAEIAAERAHSQADNMARVQAEMLAMRQEMAELRAMMANNPNVKAMNAKDAPKAKVAPAGVAETNIVPVAEADAVDAPVAGR